MKTGIYKIINISNNKYYIGSSKDIETRLSSHFRSLKKGRHVNNHLQSSFNKYGENNFITEIVEECNIKDLLLREQYYLDIGNWNKMYNKTTKSTGGGSDVMAKEFVLLHLDGHVIDRFYSGRDLKRFLNITSRDMGYSQVNTDMKTLGMYRIVSLDFFENNIEHIYSWKNYDEIYY